MYPFVLFYLFHIGIRSSNSVIYAHNDVSTSNLKHHVSHCDGQVAPGGCINEFAHGSTYNKVEFCCLATLWVLQCHRPFAILDDCPLNRMFQMLYAKVNVPSASTVSRDVKKVYEITKKNVGKVLQSHNQRIHLSVDGWPSPNTFSFLGVVVHQVQGGKLQSYILDFIKYIFY
jgi:hypothetical protein